MSRTQSLCVLESLETRALFAAPTNITYGPPLIITKGGTYKGAWASNDANVPVIRVRTAQPVIIESSTLKGKGHLIFAEADHTNITVRNTRGYGLNPNIKGRTPGRFFDVQKFDRAVLENNYLEGTSGIVVRYFAGNKSDSTTVRILRNSALNIDGRRSDGAGGYMNFNRRVSKADGNAEEGFDRVQFFQLGISTGVKNVEVGWNQIINEPGKSRVEENISVFESSGTSSSPIRIHNNYIQGAYNIKPEQTSYEDSTWQYDWGYSGGGIILADGGSTTLDKACGFVQAYKNQIVDTTNHGMTITTGHDISMYDNRILSAGVLKNGKKIAAQNVGASVWDINGNRNLPTPTYFNTGGYNNLIGWNNGNGRNDWWTPHVTTWTNNKHWSGTITLATQTAEFGVWNSKVSAAKVKVGRS